MPYQHEGIRQVAPWRVGLAGVPDYTEDGRDTDTAWAKKVYQQRRSRGVFRPGPPVPDALASVVERALMSDPGERFADATDFREALREGANREALREEAKAAVQRCG